MTAPLEAVLAHLEADQEPAIQRMLGLLAIPSVSTDPAYAGDVKRAAEWVAAALRELGLDAVVHPTAGHPIVLAHSRPEAVAAGARTRVLFYGHYDVQPPDPLELWKAPPFEPVVRDGAVHARGAADNKGPICCFLEALRAWKTVQGKLPVHLTVLIEGEEESGAVHLKPFLEAHRQELAADAVLVSDSYIWDERTPAITYALRGLVYFDVQLHGANRDLHSGSYGGMVPNPATTLVEVLGRLFDAQHRIAIPGFYDDVLPVTPAEQARLAALGFDDTTALSAVGTVPFGEAGYGTLVRGTARPSCDINGLYGGYGGPGAKTIIPSFAGAKVSFRIPANMKAAKVQAQFRAWLESQEVHGLKWKITELGACDPAIVSDNSPYVQATARAIRRVAGHDPVLIREGATIPVIVDFKNLLGLDSVMVGLCGDDDFIHAPNERFGLSRFRLGCRMHAAILEELGRV